MLFFDFWGMPLRRKIIRKLNYFEKNRGRQKIHPTFGDQGGTPEERPRTADQTGGETACPGLR